MLRTTSGRRPCRRRLTSTTRTASDTCSCSVGSNERRSRGRARNTRCSRTSTTTRRFRSGSPGRVRSCTSCRYFRPPSSRERLSPHHARETRGRCATASRRMTRETAAEVSSTFHLEVSMRAYIVLQTGGTFWS